jgi:hypothetical protein
MRKLVNKTENKSRSTSPFFRAKGTSNFFAVQPKLNVGQPGDKYENEADNVADAVIGKSENENSTFFPANTTSTLQRKPEIAVTPVITPFVQKQEEEGEEVQAKSESVDVIQKQEEEEEVQALSDSNELIQRQEEDEEVLQTAAESETSEKEDKKEDENIQEQSDGTVSTLPRIETSLKNSRGNGSALPSGFQAKMEGSLGVDLSGVKIHTDSVAVDLNKKIKARAFTNKNDIYFNQGRFNPQSYTGQHLLAHEITHTIQQGAVQEKNVNKGDESTVGLTTEKTSPAVAEGNNKNAQPLSSVSENIEEETVGADNQIDGDVESKPENVGGKQQKGTKKTGGADEKKGEPEFPTSPKDDPAFKSVTAKIKKEASVQRTHQTSGAVAGAAQAAAPSPVNERESMAQAGQVDTMSQQKPGKFDAVAFKAKLMQRINNMQLPQNAEEADNFEDNNNIEQVSNVATQDVAAEKNKASGGIEQATAQEPDTQSVPERQVQELPAPDVCEVPEPVGANRAMPARRPVSQVNKPLEDNMQEVNQKMATNEVTDEQLAKANEPGFTSALNAKTEAKKDTEIAPAKLRKNEQQVLSSSQQQAQLQSISGLQNMHNQQIAIAGNVAVQQGQTATQDSAERKRIADEINKIYQKTKTDVEQILTTLDETVATMFSDAAENAKSEFEDYVDDKMDAYKSERYSGLTGKGRWLVDKFKGLPDEVNDFFVEGRKVYIAEMDKALTKIADYVATKLNEAKKRITTGKQEVADYVTALPESLQEIGKQSAENVQNHFDELESNVDAKQDDLIDSLAQQYVQSLQSVDARIEEMKAANRGLIDKALDAVKGVIETIIKIKDTLKSILSSAISVIKTIISDPIGFLGNLISGVARGFKNFGSNILKHLTSGLVGWLTGALGPMGITIPDDVFSLKGIFSLTMQVLGLTWDYIRKKAVKLLGEPTVAALEKGFEIFQILRKDGVSGLWTYIKEKFNDLKETVIGAIKEMVITKVIEAGIKWVLGLMSPAGAFVKAAMMIIDIVKFFIERGRQIIELVKAFVDGVKAVASGSVEKVAAAIENALAKAIPVVIGFLASLLGLGGLASKVQGIIKKIRKRIDKAIDGVILKAKKWFLKAGSKLKGVAGRFVKWWKAKKIFKGADGKSHKVYFSGDGSSARLMVASNPKPFTDFIATVDVGTDENKKNAKQQALIVANKIDTKKREAVKGANETEKNKNSEKKKQELEELMVQLVEFAKVLFGTAAGDLPVSKVEFVSATIGGDIMGTNMIAQKLTTKGDAGSIPTARKHTVFDKLLKRRLGGSSYYIRGHLLNHNVHGPGKWENMTPLSKTGNRFHESVAESKVKAAVKSGAIVEYKVKPIYGRGELNTPNDADVTLKEIRAAEKHVPFGLEVEANLLKSKEENYAKKQTLVPKQTIQNPVDTSIGSYQLNSSSKKRVVLIADTVQEIKENTGGEVPENHIAEIQEKAKQVHDLNRYSQIKELFIGNSAIQASIEKLRTLPNVVLK